MLRTAALALAAGLALAACSPAGTASDPDSAEAQGLAEQLNANLAELGLPQIGLETAEALYGTDGGVSCENIDELQHQLSLSQFGNNANNLRRVVLDPSLVAYDLAVIATYCPDKADEFKHAFRKLDTEETIPTP
ncbi:MULTISPECIES: hypothetical protein [unclassified Nocardioides]|uniref:hypothetical protein n=1 Tax=unclassified Nocardioides TaxID=2615069 RepID=UPI001E5D8E47|nr:MULTISPECIES: hypothetical protein [unclassified Nocardioides]MCD4526761.1 hypothetical protein [Nocardioides sp. cx-173]MCD4536568.1 hypothetical protein [Nocardioides sp. cx-169]UGB43867.1 hypothetical protein LQ940_10200 [Nocardioides sp. cx-173]